MLLKVNHKHLVKEWLFTFTIHSQIIMEIKKKRHLQVLCPPNAWILLTLSYRIKYVDGSYLIYKELGKKPYYQTSHLISAYFKHMCSIHKICNLY